VYCLCVNVYCTVLLPPGVNPIAVKIYQYQYQKDICIINIPQRIRYPCTCVDLYTEVVFFSLLCLQVLFTCFRFWPRFTFSDTVRRVLSVLPNWHALPPVMCEPLYVPPFVGKHVRNKGIGVWLMEIIMQQSACTEADISSASEEIFLQNRTRSLIALVKKCPYPKPD